MKKNEIKRLLQDAWTLYRRSGINTIGLPLRKFNALKDYLKINADKDNFYYNEINFYAIKVDD